MRIILQYNPKNNYVHFIGSVLYYYKERYKGVSTVKYYKIFCFSIIKIEMSGAVVFLGLTIELAPELFEKFQLGL